MKMTLTEKDKKLLVMLSIFVIVVCIGYWGIYPALKKKNKIQNEIDIEKATKEQNEMMIGWLPSLEKDNVELEAKIVDMRKVYFPIMTNSEIDKYFTAMALDYSLEAYDLTIDAVYSGAQLEPYQYSLKAAVNEDDVSADGYVDYSGEDTAEMDASTDETMDVVSDEEEMDDLSSAGIYSSNVTLRLGGKEDDLLRLIDDLSANSKLHIVSFQWEDNSNVVVDEENDNYEMVTEKGLTLSLVIYMYEE